MIWFWSVVIVGLAGFGVWMVWYSVIKPGRDRLRDESTKAYPVEYAIHKVAGGWQVTVDGGTGWNLESVSFTRANREQAMRAAQKWVKSKREAKYVERGKF